MAKLKTTIGKSEIQGKGLMAAKDLKAGESVGVAHINDWPTKDIGENYNHSDNPNSISKKVGNKRLVLPLRNLKKGEEITVDYRQRPELEQPEGFGKPNIARMMQDGGPSIMDGMSRGRMAIAAELGNPAAKRMLSPNPKTGMTPEGEGTHYMASMGKYAVPLLQDKGDEELEYNENPKPSSEDIKFNTEEEAEYFAEHYKKHVPESSALHGRKIGGPVIFDMLRGFQYGGATHSDSLAVFNNANKINAHYTSLYKKGFYDKPNQTPFSLGQMYPDTQEGFRSNMKSIKSQTIDTYKYNLSRLDGKGGYVPNAYKDYKRTYPKATVKNYEADVRRSLSEARNSSENKFYYKDLLPSQIDPRSPSALIDVRIKPQFKIKYFAKDTDKNPAGGLRTETYGYDPLAVKPGDMLTKAEAALRLKKYGPQGIPNSMLNIPGSKAPLSKASSSNQSQPQKQPQQQTQKIPEKEPLPEIGRLPSRVPSAQAGEIVPQTFNYTPKKQEPIQVANRSQTVMEADPNKQGGYKVKELRQVPYSAKFPGEAKWEPANAPRVMWINESGEEVEEDPRKSKSNTLVTENKSYQFGGPILKNTFAQASPLSMNMQGLSSKSDEEQAPGFGLTIGKSNIGGNAMKNIGLNATGTVDLNAPYSGEAPSLYGKMDLRTDPKEVSNGVFGQAEGRVGAGVDPNLGFNADFAGGYKLQFANKSLPTYRNEKWKQGAMRAEVGPELGAYYRSKGVDVASGKEGDVNNTKAGLTYGASGKIEVQPFRFPLRLSAEGSMRYNPGAGKTIEGGSDAGKVQGKWQPGIQIGARIPLNAFNKPKNTAIRVPPQKESDWVMNRNPTPTLRDNP